MIMREKTSQRGMTLIEVLVAIAIFAFGLLGIAGMYQKSTKAQLDNQDVLTASAAGNQFWAILQANPLVLADIGTSGAVTYTTVSAAPALLQPWLSNLFTSSANQLASPSVTITKGNDARGNVCSTAAPVTCGVTLSLTWTPVGNASVSRTQTFNYQVGF